MEKEKGRRTGSNCKGAGTTEINNTEVVRCASCGKEIISKIYTDRFYETLCVSCLLRLHEA